MIGLNDYVQLTSVILARGSSKYVLYAAIVKRANERHGDCSFVPGCAIYICHARVTTWYDILAVVIYKVTQRKLDRGIIWATFQPLCLHLRAAVRLCSDVDGRLLAGNWTV